MGGCVIVDIMLDNCDVIIKGKPYPATLIILPIQKYDVILAWTGCPSIKFV